jgi:hypothetical protein
MSDNAMSPVSRWIEENLHRLDATPSERGMTTVHLDEIGLAPEAWRDLGSLGRIFAEAARTVEAAAVWRKLLLTVFLDETEAILSPPDSDPRRYLEIRSDVPPALYLMDLELWLSAIEIEHYKLPLDVIVEGQAKGSYSVYLSQQRGLTALRGSETYFNTITFEHFRRP